MPDCEILFASSHSFALNRRAGYEPNTAQQGVKEEQTAIPSKLACLWLSQANWLN
jgi:hypothetical protein